MKLLWTPSVDSQDRSSPSAAPLINQSEKEFEPEILDHTRCRARRNWIYLIHAIAFVFYSAVFFTTTGFWTRIQSNNTYAYTPAIGAVKYLEVAYDGKLDRITPYRGTPRPELDQAWQDLLENNNIRISKDELVKLNRSAIELYDGSGFYGQLSVYHHLHCLKFMRQSFYPEYYSGSDAPDRQTHIDHCFDDIRQALMCHADTSIVTFDWKSPEWRRPTPNFAVDHTCVDWTALDGWAAKRSFSLFDQKSLVHPQLGLAYPMIDGEIEDISHGPGMHILWPEGHSPNEEV